MRAFGKLTALAAVTLATLSAAPALHAQDYPSRPLRWVVGYPPGGGSDFLARVIGNELSKSLGQPVVVENQPGAASVLAATSVTRSPPDGYTLFSGDNGSLVYNSALFAKPRYDPVKDFAPVGLMARFPLILVVNSQTPAKTAQELFEAIKAAPSKTNYASPGIGSPHHLAMELLIEKAGLAMNHVPYRGAAPAVQDVLANQLPLMVADAAVGLPQIRAGGLKPLAVFSKTRLAALPDVPTLQELGYKDIEAYAWQGLVTVTGTPAAIQSKLTAELQKALANPEVSKKLLDFGLEPIPSDAKALSAYVASESAYWHPLIKARNISLE